MSVVGFSIYRERIMSYSFQVKGATKAEARAAAVAELDKVVDAQPVHAKDRDAALANIDGALAALGSDGDDKRDVALSCNGSVGWSYTEGVDPIDAPLTAVSISTNAYLATK